jgi:formylglycine-generating enzyme required for sulfatase activity
VYEWVGDWYEGYGQVPPAGVDVQGPASGSFRVYRGGSWGIDPQYARVADRYGDVPGNRRSILGVRLLRTVP